MGKKFIIELEDENYHQYSDSEPSDYLWRVKGFNALVFDAVGLRKLTPYTEPDLEQVRKEAYQKGYETGYEDGYNEPGKNQQEAYQRGLADAWDACKKIGCYEIDGGYPTTQMLNLFDRDDLPKILSDYTADEAIEKIRQYEQEQEKKEKHHTWICSEAGEPSTDITLICSKCGYAITLKLGDTQALNFCPKCGDNKRGEQDE